MARHRAETAIVGFGNVAERFYLPALANAPRHRLVAIVDPDPSRREIAHDLAGADVRVERSLAGLGHLEPGVALNLTPAHLHATTTRRLLHLGWDVFTEKPGAASAARWQSLTAFADDRSRVVVSAPTAPYGPTSAALAGLLDREDLGRVVSARAEVAMGGPARRGWIEPDRAWYLHAGGGIVGDIGLYAFSYLVALFGPPATLRFASTPMHQEVRVGRDVVAAASPSAVGALLLWSHGVYATVDVAYRADRDPAARLEVHGTARSASVDLESVDGVVDLAPEGDPPVPADGTKYELALDLVARAREDPAFRDRHWADVAAVLAITEAASRALARTRRSRSARSDAGPLSH